LSREVWVPGKPGPHDEFVRNLLEQIEQMGKDVAVSVELADGSLFDLISILARPGFGFITLQPHPEGEEPSEVVIPVASIAQIRIGRADTHQRLGFALPVAEPKG
jgi:hypothetical protein